MQGNPAKYNKFWAAAAAGLVVLAAAVSDGHISPAEWFSIAAAIIGPGAVYQVTNAK